MLDYRLWRVTVTIEGYGPTVPTDDEFDSILQWFPGGSVTHRADPGVLVLRTTLKGSTSEAASRIALAMAHQAVPYRPGAEAAAESVGLEEENK